MISLGQLFTRPDVHEQVHAEVLRAGSDHDDEEEDPKERANNIAPVFLCVCQLLSLLELHRGRTAWTKYDEDDDESQRACSD